MLQLVTCMGCGGSGGWRVEGLSLKLKVCAVAASEMWPMLNVGGVW